MVTEGIETLSETRYSEQMEIKTSCKGWRTRRDKGKAEALNVDQEFLLWREEESQCGNKMET